MSQPFLFRNDVLGAPRSTASPSTSTLLIIDAQNEYSTGKLTVENVSSSRKVIGELLDKYRKAGGKVVHVLHDVPEGAPVFTPGTELAEEFEELKPKEAEAVLRKNHPGAFTDTSLHTTLQSYGETGKKLVIVGYMAHVCVSTTTREADQAGYEVLVVEDAVGDRPLPGVSAEQLVKVALAELADAFATVVKSSEIA